jgi:subtilisin family serine protease
MDGGLIKGVNIKATAWRIVFFLILFSPIRGFSQNQKLEKFLKDKEAAARKAEHEISEFARSNQTPRSFNTVEGTHYFLVEIRKGRPIYRMTLNADAMTSTSVSGLRNSAGLGFDLQGSGMLVGVFDDGLVKDHIELDNRVISKEGKQEMNHATHVTGTIVATGINPLAQGMAPKAKASTFYFDNDEVKMAALAGPDQSSLLFSNHSYGETTGWVKSNNAWNWTGDPSVSSDEDFRFGFYGERARSLDELSYLAPYYSIVWAAGNDRADVGNGSRLPDCNGGTGYDCIIPDAVAKNIITVGAVNKVLNYSNSSSVQMSFFSSWGPTDDGRIKPDVVGAGVDLFSLSSIGANTYSTLSGTSMATPNVTGTLLLLQELYARLHGGNFMRAATLKALIIHTARESGNFPGPDYSYGWGLVNATTAAQLLRDQDEQQQIVGEYKLVSGQPFELELHPKADQKITATIVWTDPAAKPLADAPDPSNLMLVNDLDMRIVDEQGIQQFPWRLDPLNPAMKASRGDNFRDNVEKIEIDLPAQKNYKLQISNKGQLVGNQQEFSLILTYRTTDTTPKTYYWVGDAGNWSDVNHWSLTSDGISADALPSANDKVIVDENSFDGVGEDIIHVTEDVSISFLMWLTSKPSGIAFNDKKITISRR